MALLKILQIAFLILIPTLMLWLEKRSKFVRTFSPVIFCYLIGILIGNQHFVKVDSDLSLTACQVSIALAIPLLLFSLNLTAWFRLARPTIVSFVLIFCSVMVMSFLGNALFHERVPESAKVAGMLVGVYTGGTPNMAAIGTALGVESEAFLMLNAADVVMGAIYLLLLLTVVGRLWGKLLPSFPTRRLESPEQIPDSARVKSPARSIAASLGLALLIVVVAGALSQLLPQNIRESVAILVITTLAVIASLVPKVRAMPKTTETGQFFLLIFCVAIGTTADFSKFLSSTLTLILYVAFVMYGSVILHLFLCALLRLDRDTVIITSTAAIYGPAFIGPVAVALKNREIIFSGIACGLVGYAVGNYLGLSLAWALM